MLDTIAELEEEIKQFHKNIKDSNELTKALGEVVSEAKALEAELSALPAQLDALVRADCEENTAQIKEIQKSYAKELCKINEEFSCRLNESLEAAESLPKKIKDTSDKQLQAYLGELVSVMDKRMEKLSAAEQRLVGSSVQLEEKYNDFVSRLEASNIDKLHKYCYEMNKSLSLRLNIALGGVGAALVIAAISMILQL